MVRPDYLERFIVVAEQKSISKASEILFIPQPTLSRQMSALEDEIGARLLIRDNQGVGLTRAGEVLAEEAPWILGHLEYVVKKTRSITRGVERESLTIKAFYPADAYYFDTCRKFTTKFPDTSLLIDYVTEGNGIHLVESFKTDACIVPVFDLFIKENFASSLSSKLVCVDELCIVTAKESALAKNEKCAIEDLPIENIYRIDNAIPDMSDAYRAYVNSWYERSGLAFNGVSAQDEYIPLETAIMNVRLGKNTALQFYQVALSQMTDCAILPLDPPVPVEIYLVWRKDNPNPALREYLKLL